MQYKFLLTGIILFSTFTVSDLPVLPVQGPGNAFLSVKIPTSPFWELGKQKQSADDTESLKQSSWYAEAIKGIEESEYEIRYDETTKSYTSANRKNNLRSFFTSHTFKMRPRNDSADKWELQLTTLGVVAGERIIYRPSETPIVTLDKKNIRFSQDDNFINEYINTKEGVRQNFIISKEPVGKPKALNLKLQANKGWFINKVHGKEIHFAKATKTGYDKKITYNGLKVWDANHKELPASFSVNGDIISIDVNSDGAVYPVTIDPISTTPAAILESNQSNSLFGRQVSSAGDVNGDGYSDVIIGAEIYSNGQANEGAAFVYHGSSSGISTTAAVVIEGNQADAYLGASVASAGDVNGDGYSDIIVGASLYDNGQSDEGAAFVYYGSATGIHTPASAVLEANVAGIMFGFSVACAGDVNGDGYSDVVCGAVYYSNGQVQEGAAYFFYGTAAGISTTMAGSVESNVAVAQMGSAVASAGDINADGYSDVLIGAHYYGNGQVNEGATYICYGSSAGLGPAILFAEGNQDAAFLGETISSAGDVNGDGYSDVIISAWGFDNGQTNEGIFYVYHGSSGGIVTPAATVVEGNIPFLALGISVATAGDINGDGYGDIIVAAPNYTNGESNEGAAIVYQGSITGINMSPVAILQTNQANASVYSVACAGDVNGDGYSDLLVGSHLYDNGQTNEGAAFVYHGSASGLSATNNWAVESNQTDARMGWSVASAGDVNGDGYSDVIVGAFLYDNGQTDEGRAFVYHGSVSGLSASPNWTAEVNASGAHFGWSVASAGDVNGDGYGDVVVGGPAYDNGTNGSGVVTVYHGSVSGLSAVANWWAVMTSFLSNDFGFSVASAGDVNGDGYGDLIIGSQTCDTGLGITGKVWVHHGSASGLSATANWTVNGVSTNAEFGHCVASAGDVNGDGFADVIVGADSYDNAQTNAGKVFVYHGSSSGLSATVNWTAESNQANAYFGCSVACAGDVNGDGYSDLIIGADDYDNGQTDEGSAFLYYGSATGLSATANWTGEINQASANFGYSVASAGDVNGDGYSDVIIGSYTYDNGETDEGAAFVYHGSASGLSASPNWTAERNQANAYFGVSVASSGDVNGDGYSDVIIGALYYDNVQIDEGGAFVYLGNNGGGKRNNLRLYNQNLTSPISHVNVTEPNLFGAGLFAKSPLGRVKGKLVWEVKKQGTAFSGNPITNSTGYLDKQTTFTDLGIAGIELKSNVQKVGSRQNKVRTRVEYDKVTAITGQVYGPWRYPAGYTMGAYGMNSVPLPITLISFSGQFINADDVQLKWITSNEVNMQTFIAERSSDGMNFTAVGELAAKGFGSNRADYTLTDKNVQHNLLYYRLRLKEKSGDESFTKTITVSRSKLVNGFITPNPVILGKDAVLNIHSLANNSSVVINIYNMQGQLVFTSNKILQNGRNQIPILTKGQASGMYVVNILGDGVKEGYRLMIQ